MSSVSLLCLECILPHMDADKRITLSFCLPSIRKLDKSIPIHFDDLKIRSSSIKMNGRKFRLGEIRIPTKADNYFLEDVNSGGGTEWKSMRDAVPEPGDIVLDQKKDPDLLEQDKMEIMQYLRQSFMKAQEKFENSETTYDPFDEFIYYDFGDPNFEKICSPTDSVLSKMFNVTTVIHEMNRVKVEEDELTRMYPKTFKRVSKYNEKDMSPKDIPTCFLSKLIYPQFIYEHFNQLTVYNKKGLYQNPLPNGLSLRKAFKQLSTLIFGGRKLISVKSISITGEGIVPLPVGFKIDKVQTFQERSRTLTNVYESIVKHIDTLHLSDLTERISNMPIVQSSRQVECKFSEIGASPQLVFHLLNEVLVLTIFGKSTIFEVVQHSLMNDNRKIGSKIFMNVCLGNMLLLSSRLSEIGFKETPVSSSTIYGVWPMFRSLSGGRKAVLDVMKDGTHIPADNRYHTLLPVRLCLEIVED